MSRIFFLCLIIVFKSGCAGLGLSELSDAKTTPKNMHVLEVNTGLVADIIPYSIYNYNRNADKDIPRVFKKSFLPFAEVGYKYGLLDNFDIRFNVWSANFPFNYFFKELYNDYGMKLGTKFRLTPEASTHHLALLSGFSFYRLDQKLYEYQTKVQTYIYSIGFVYSYTISEITNEEREFKKRMEKLGKSNLGDMDNKIRSFYFGAKSNYLYGNFNRLEYDNKELNPVNYDLTKVPFMNMFTGLTLGYVGQNAFEVQLVAAKNSLTDKLEGFFTVSGGLKIFF